ncbi:NAD-dependent epimerase/dehydratase family protein [Virgibacillus sp. JSM 102003]|uniref:NAD-dependent epimerase/dehydratase family protein n=1 Tax=Virgibacillus sp. JSM 102003 TaxID=1562108 RepID=UPI0035BFCBD6
MRVLLTGGTGFIGLNIAEKMLESGNDVILYGLKPLVENTKKKFQNYEGNYYFVRGDVLNQDLIDLTIKKFRVSVIIHGAAITPSIDREKMDAKNIMNVNCMGTIEVLEAARKNNVSKFVYLSSVAVYGNEAFESKLLKEDISVSKPHTLYEISKFSAESVVTRYKEVHGMDIIITRIGDAYGPWEHHTGVRDLLSPPFQATRFALEGKKALLPRKGYKSWVYSKDIAISVEKLLEAPYLKYNLYNISSGHFWSMEDWCQLLSKRYTDFEYQIVEEPNKENIIFHGTRDNAPLDINRLIGDTNYVPSYDIGKSFEDYVLWVEENINLLTGEGLS